MCVLTHITVNLHHMLTSFPSAFRIGGMCVGAQTWRYVLFSVMGGMRTGVYNIGLFN